MIHPCRGVMPKAHWIAGSADIIGDGAVVSPGPLVPTGSLLMGAPARIRRSVTDKDLELTYPSAKSYVGLAAEYRAAG